MVAPQHRLNLSCPLVDPPFPAGPAEGTGDLRARQVPPQGWCRGDLEHGQGVTVGQFPKAQGRRVELPKEGAQLVRLTLARPDQALMRPGQHLDGLGQFAVGSNRPVMMPVSAGQLGQHRGVAGVGLGPRGRVPLPVAGHGHRVHGIDLVAGRDERTDKQAPLSLRGHHHVGWLVRMGGDHGVESGNAFHALRQPRSIQPAALAVEDLDIVMLFGPVETYEDLRHQHLLVSIGAVDEPEVTAAS